MLVVVAIPTFKRPAALETALATVTAQARAVSDDRVTVRVLVVDNDANATGRAVAEAFDVSYSVEPSPGIAAVRNRAIDDSSDADAVIFIDDDEVPEQSWLRNLLSAHAETGAHAVAGRVVTRFPDDVEEWVRASGAFIRPVRTDRQVMTEAATNNLLLDLARIRPLGLRFDERFGLTGGSDSMYTRLLVARGGTIRWAQDAVVVEQEDAARFTRAWVLMRTFRFGNTAARVSIALAGSSSGRLMARVRMCVRGGARVAGGLVRWLWGTLSRSLRHRARGLRTAYRGAGMIGAAIGYAHDEYGRRRASA
ncbi:glycosyltransferase family 2 protein [Microbacterium sp. SSM24]|uniref:glycosyltransferase family 2 protein n=1 Tax=Microbacterium sp. SSM24 TaxID=2991714 RepID=UPI0022266557|nr:glycosyltransferase [Microbacterium sp. SSM24]MCW3492780.1 glycosyltransferase [Microbacterium sp. SSM24]